jgi:hypothetical protein
VVLSELPTVINRCRGRPPTLSGDVTTDLIQLRSFIRATTRPSLATHLPEFKTMDSGYITACAALAGAALGGLTSFASSWTTLRVQMRAEQEASSKSRRQELYKSFIEEASRMYGDALIHDTLEVSVLIGLYALINRMRVTSSRTVIEHAAWVARTITDTYNQPNKSPAELEAMIQSGGGDLLHAFSEVCRKELESNLST